jgi:hypothetical protein
MKKKMTSDVQIKAAVIMIHQRATALHEAGEILRKALEQRATGEDPANYEDADAYDLSLAATSAHDKVINKLYAVVRAMFPEQASKPLTYAEIVCRREANSKKAKEPCCFGCGKTFASYGMTEAEGFTTTTGKTYCNSDCHGESEVRSAETAEFNSLSEEY